MSKKVWIPLIVIATVSATWGVAQVLRRTETVGVGTPGYHPELLAALPPIIPDWDATPDEVPEEEVPAESPTTCETAPNANLTYIKYVAVRTNIVGDDGDVKFVVTEDHVKKVPAAVNQSLWAEKLEGDVVPLPTAWQHWDDVEDVIHLSALRPSANGGRFVLSGVKNYKDQNVYHSGTWYLSPQ